MLAAGAEVEQNVVFWVGGGVQWGLWDGLEQSIVFMCSLGVYYSIMGSGLKVTNV